MDLATTVCDTCNQPHPWPDGTVPKHPHSKTDQSSTAWMGERAGTGRARAGAHGPTERPSWPIDPVLRQALIDKGVLTPQDLRDAEAKIVAVTGALQNQFNGQPIREKNP